jgi:K+-sensing histidine kinase KdpD
MLRGKNLEFRRRREDDLPPIRTDRTKLKQVLLNLLSNAIKFTQEGACRAVRRWLDAGQRRPRIVVADTGIGIKPEHLGAIFEDFRQIDQSHTREYGGTGLGLSITKKLLTLLGGDVVVESTYGSGTTFTIDLPSLEDHAAGIQRGGVTGDRRLADSLRTLETIHRGPAGGRRPDRAAPVRPIRIDFFRLPAQTNPTKTRSIA